MGDVNVFLVRDPRLGFADGGGGLEVLVELESRELTLLRARGVLLKDASGAKAETGAGELLAVSCAAPSFTGDLKGVLKGERKGLERVWEATSILRRLAAGVDILKLLVAVQR